MAEWRPRGGPNAATPAEWRPRGGPKSRPKVPCRSAMISVWIAARDPTAFMTGVRGVVAEAAGACCGGAAVGARGGGAARGAPAAKAMGATGGVRAKVAARCSAVGGFGWPVRRSISAR